MVPDPAVRSVQRALDILELLADRRGGLTLTELATHLEFPKSSVHALLHTLRRRGFVSQGDGQGTFHLGLRLWELGHAFELVDELARRARPIMQRLVDEFDEICQFSIRDGVFNVYLAKVDCRQPIRLISEVGGRLYCHATGLGKALLSVESDETIDQLYADVVLPRFTPNTITDLAALKDELRRARERGHAEDREEYMPGLRCVAVPIRLAGGLPPAALSLSMPTQRATPERLAEGVRLLRAAATELVSPHRTANGVAQAARA